MAGWRLPGHGLAALGAVLSAGAVLAQEAAPVDVRVESRLDLPPQMLEGSFGGISGLDHDRRRHRWLLVSDDRSEHGPARLYRARLSRDAAGALHIRKIMRIVLRDRDGRPFPEPGTGREAVDSEAIRVTPDGRRILLSSEGDPRDGFGPAIRRADRKGRETGMLPLPANLHRDAAGKRGPRDNNAIEGLDFAPDGALWLAMEAPLVEDGPVAGVGRTALARFTRIREGEPTRQFAYRLDAIPVPPQGKLADNGVSEILALDPDRLLVLERSGAQGADGRFTFHCRLYLADFREATDIAALPSLAAADGIRPAHKTPLLDFDRLPEGTPGNLEGMAWWPSLDRGRRFVLLVTDNNFERDRATRFILLSFGGLGRESMAHQPLGCPDSGAGLCGRKQKEIFSPHGP